MEDMKQESYYVNPENPERSELRHQLIAEFRKNLKGHYEVPAETNGVVVLSAPPALESKESVDRREKTQENISRIDFAFDLWKQVAAKKIGKNMEELKEEDLHGELLPPFVLNGETEQLEPMREIALALGVPAEKIHLVDCGKRGIGNTKTQFLGAGQDQSLAKAKHLTFISSSYHVPRVMRTGDMNLPKEMDFDVIGVPYNQFSYDIQKKIRGEVKRIIAYSAKGDIARQPREGK